MTYKITDSKEVGATLDEVLVKIDEYSHTLMQADEEKKAAFSEYQRKLRIIANKYNSKDLEAEMKKLQDSIPEIENSIYKEFYDNLFDMIHYYEKKGIDITSFLEDALEHYFDIIIVTEPERSRLRICKEGIYTLGPEEDENGVSWGEDDDELDFVMTWDKEFSSKELEDILNDVDLRLRYVYIAGLIKKFLTANKSADIRKDIDCLLSSVNVELKDELSDAELRFPGNFIARALPSGRCALERQNSSVRVLLFDPKKDVDEVQEVIENGLTDISKKIAEDAEYKQYLKLKEKYEK